MELTAPTLHPSYPMDIAIPPGYARAGQCQSRPVHATSHSISSQSDVNRNMLVLLNNFRIGLCD